MRRLKAFLAENKAKLILLGLILLTGITFGIIFGLSSISDKLNEDVTNNIKNNLVINSYAILPTIVKLSRLFVLIYILGLFRKTRFFSSLVLVVKGYSIGVSVVLLSSIGGYGLLVNLIYIVVDVLFLLPAIFWFILQSFEMKKTKLIWSLKFLACLIYCVVLSLIHSYLLPVFIVRIVNYI